MLAEIALSLSANQSAKLGQWAGLVGSVALCVVALCGAYFFAGKSIIGRVAFYIAALGAAASVVIRLVQLISTRT